MSQDECSHIAAIKSRISNLERIISQKEAKIDELSSLLTAHRCTEVEDTEKRYQLRVEVLRLREEGVSREDIAVKYGKNLYWVNRMLSQARQIQRRLGIAGMEG